MSSGPEAVTILVITAIVMAPWILASVLAARDALRRPTWATCLVAAIVLVGATPAAVVYLAYRVWRGPALPDAPEAVVLPAAFGPSR